MKTSESIAKIAPALVAASGKIAGAAKAGNNTHFKSRYATLESVIEATRAILSENELCVLQGPETMEGNLLTITTRLLHSSGEWIETAYQMPVIKADPQASGSATTYGRRYALMAMLNVPALDDDGEAAMGRSPANQPQQQPAKPKQTLSERAEAFGSSMKGARTKAALDRVWKLGEGLRAELDKSDPERLVELSELHTRCADAIAEDAREAA